MTAITTAQFVTLEDESVAFVRRIDEKSQRAVLVFTAPAEIAGCEAMRRLSTLTPVTTRKGTVKAVKDVKAAIAAARAGELVK